MDVDHEEQAGVEEEVVQVGAGAVEEEGDNWNLNYDSSSV